MLHVILLFLCIFLVSCKKMEVEGDGGEVLSLDLVKVDSKSYCESNYEIIAYELMGNDVSVKKIIPSATCSENWDIDLELDSLMVNNWLSHQSCKKYCFPKFSSKMLTNSRVAYGPVLCVDNGRIFYFETKGGCYDDRGRVLPLVKD